MDHADTLATLGHEDSVGIAWINEFHELTWTSSEGTFSLVQPSSPADAAEKATRLLDQARAEKCAIVVLPELSLDPGGVQTLVNWGT